MNRKVLFLCLFGLIGFAACTSSDQPSPTVEAPTATIATATPTSTATAQPTPTATVTPTATPTPIAAPDYVWLDSDGLLIYSRDGNLCMKDGDTDPVYLLPADAYKYYARLFDDSQTIMLFGRQAIPDGVSYFQSHYDDIWRINRQTGEVVYLASTLDILRQLDVERMQPISSMYQVPGSDTYVFFTGESDSYSMDLFRLDENGQLTTLLELGELASGFEVSPDGQHIVFVMRDLGVDREFDGIGLIDVDGGNYRPRIITYHMITSYGKMSIIPRPVWREDSAGFWIAIPPPYRDKLPNIMTTWYVPVDGEPVQLGSFERPLGFIYAATFSPDGRYVAYVAVDNKELLLEPGIHIMRSDGSDDMVYFSKGTDYSDYFSHWEDNTHFIFGTWADRIRSTYRGGIGEEPVLIETFDLDAEEPIISIPAEGCEP